MGLVDIHSSVITHAKMHAQSKNATTAIPSCLPPLTLPPLFAVSLLSILLSLFSVVVAVASLHQLRNDPAALLLCTTCAVKLQKLVHENTLNFLAIYSTGFEFMANGSQYKKLRCCISIRT